MAIDTAAKQMSMLNFGDGNNLTVLPIPPAAFLDADWQHLLDLYSGIAFSTVSAISGPFCIQAAEIYSAGQNKAEVFNAGSACAEVFVAGAAKGEVCD